jgi:predicted alpha/beta hydrolase family esterase
MKTSDVDILIVPGLGDSDSDHWQSRWERNLRTAQRVHQDDWLAPNRDDWVKRIAAAVDAATQPVVLVGHSLGCIAIIHAAKDLPRGNIAGAFLVGTPDVDKAHLWPPMEGRDWDPKSAGFAPLPMAALPFPLRMISSSDDPYCSVDRSQELAALWGADLSVIANAGHLNSESGHGPWPEGLLTFGQFLRGLG